MEWVVGTFTLIAVMAAITSGGMGIRLLYIDTEYDRLIRSENERLRAARGDGGPVSQPKTVARKQRLPDRTVLLGLHAKKSGVVFDGICMIGILADGLVTVLGLSPSLDMSAIAAFVLFLDAVVLLQYHVRVVLRLSR